MSFFLYSRQEFVKAFGEAYIPPKGLNQTFELALWLPSFADVDREYERLSGLGVTLPAGAHRKIDPAARRSRRKTAPRISIKGRVATSFFATRPFIQQADCFSSVRIILLIYQSKAIIPQITVDRVSQPSGDRLLLLLKGKPYGGRCDNGMRCHISWIVIPCNAVPKEQAHTDFLELRDGIFQNLLINVRLFFCNVHYSCVEVILDFRQISVPK